MSRARDVLVLGRSGQLAQALVEVAAEQDMRIRCIGRGEADLARAASLDVLQDLPRADVIINAAAYTAVDQAETDEAAALALNRDGAGRAGALARAWGVPLVHVSTDYVYDGEKGAPYREDDPVHPLGAYARTKLAGEEAVVASGADAAILRTAWVVSPFGRNFVRTILERGRTVDHLRIVADQHGSPTSALDLARACLIIGQNLITAPGDATRRGVFHVANSGHATWADVAEAISDAALRHGERFAAISRIRTEDYPTPARRPRDTRLDTTRLAARHGLTLPHWQQAIENTVKRLLSAERTGVRP